MKEDWSYGGLTIEWEHRYHSDEELLSDDIGYHLEPSPAELFEIRAENLARRLVNNIGKDWEVLTQQFQANGFSPEVIDGALTIANQVLAAYRLQNQRIYKALCSRPEYDKHGHRIWYEDPLSPD